MQRGYTRKEALALVNQVFETHGFLGPVPKGTRGQVIEAIDVGDHWNILIEWQSQRVSTRTWYDKYDVQNSMHPVQSAPRSDEQDQKSANIEIWSSHDLTANSPGARRTGTHSYQVTAGEFVGQLRLWRSDHRRKDNSIGLKTVDRKQIWISELESRKLEKAINTANYRVVLD